MSLFLKQLTGLCLIRLLMDLMLPEGESRRYADLGMGLVQMLHMLGALMRLLEGIG